MAGVLRSLVIALSLDYLPVEKGAGRVTKSMSDLEKAAARHEQALDSVGTVAVGVGGALVAGFGAAVGAAMTFDKQMSNVGAVSNATGKDLEGLRQAALKAGKDTAFSATEAAKAESELAKVGISAADIMGGALAGSLSLAAAGQLDLEEAATLSGQAMKIFNLQGKDVGKIADVLAAGANKSAADVHQLGESLRAGGQTASQFGLGLTDTVGVLAAFSDNALIGSDAGTSLKTMLLHLANPTDKTKELMGDLGIAAYDTGGRFVGMGNLAAQLQSKLGGLTQQQRDAALAQIFGSDAMRGASILYKIGEKGVQDYTRAVDQQGAATTVAAKNMDNLAGDLEKLKGSIETALIQSGSTATGVLRGLTQSVGGLVGLFNELPQPVQSTVSVIGGLVGVVGAVAGAFVLGAPKVAAFKESLADMGPRGQRFGKAITGIGSFLTGPWGIALGAATIGLGYFAAKHEEAQEKVKELTATLDKQTGAITNGTRAMVVQRLEEDGLLKVAQELGVGLEAMTDAALGNKNSLAQVNSQLLTANARMTQANPLLGEYALSNDEVAAKIALVRSAIFDQTGTLRDSAAQWKREQEATKGAKGATEAAGTAMEGTGNKAATAAAKVAELTDKVRGFNDLAADATTTSISFKNHIDDMREAFKKNALQIDQHTGAFRLNSKANRDNATLVIDAIRKAGEHAAAVAKNTGSVKSGNAAFNAEINVLRGVLEKQHLSRVEIDKLISKYVDLKNKVNDATKGIHDRKVRIEVRASGELVGYKVSGGTLLKNADGGILPGYTPGRDPHMFYSPTGGRLGLSGGEAVMRPEWTRAVGPQYVNQMNAAARRGGVSGVSKAMADPRWKLGGEGLAFAGGGIITKGSVTGLASVKAMATKANTLYGIWASNIGTGISKALSKMLMGGPGIQNALKWARSQAGKPYVWSAVGPGGYDCSGWTSALTNVIQGRKPIHQRRHTTYSFGASGGPDGFVRNRKSGFMVGVTDAGVGHMAGTLGGVAVESSGGRGVRVGGGARGYNNSLFTRRYGLAKFDDGGVLEPGFTPAYNGTGKPEYVFTQQQMQQGNGPGRVEIHNHFHIPNHPNKYEIGKQVYEVLEPYMERSKRKLPT